MGNTWPYLFCPGPVSTFRSWKSVGNFFAIFVGEDSTQCALESKLFGAFLIYCFEKLVEIHRLLHLLSWDTDGGGMVRNWI